MTLLNLESTTDWGMLFLANRWMELTTDPIQKYKLGLFLQLESEAKVRLRPLLARHGISRHLPMWVERRCGFSTRDVCRLSIDDDSNGVRVFSR
jgi:hypothetical protein